MNLETATGKLREPEVFLLSITEYSDKNVASVELKANNDENRAKQREDSAIATILQKKLRYHLMTDSTTAILLE